MAGKKGGKGKGIAFGKLAKIDSAQQKMFIAVCIVSVILGVTVVGVIYFMKVIAFNGKLIDEKDKVIKDYVAIQKSLDTISQQVDELRNNEALEVVGRTRSDDCMKYTEQLKDEEEEIENIELARICTALRVIPDAIPATENKEATLASMNQLLLWSDPAIDLDGLTGSEAGEMTFVDANGHAVETTLAGIGVSLAIDDTTERVHRALDTIENSIRNFDIVSASISFSGDTTQADSIELGATFNAYYSTSVSIARQSKKVCADDQSDKCTGKRGSGGGD